MSKYKINSFIFVIRKENKYYFGLNGINSLDSERSFYFNEEEEMYINRLAKNEFIDENELRKVFGQNKMEYFIKERIIVSYEQDIEGIYSRSKAFYEINGYKDAQTKLGEKKVLILGCGGIGTHVAWNFSVLGVGKLTLVDFDVIEESNLNRQLLFDINDIGKEKTDVLKEKLNKINANIEIKTINKKISSEKDLEAICCEEKYDLIIKSLDSPNQVSKWLDHVCKKNKLISISAIASGKYSYIGPTLLGDKSEGFSEIIEREDVEFEVISGKMQSISIVICNMSNKVVTEGIKVLLKIDNLRYVNKIYVEDILDNINYVFTSKKIEHEVNSYMKYSTIQNNIMIVLLFNIAYMMTNNLFILFLGYIYGILTSVIVYDQKKNILRSVFINESLFIAVNNVNSIYKFILSKEYILSQVIILVVSIFTIISVGIIMACIIASFLYLIKEKLRKTKSIVESIESKM